MRRIAPHIGLAVLLALAGTAYASPSTDATPRNKASGMVQPADKPAMDQAATDKDKAAMSDKASAKDEKATENGKKKAKKVAKSDKATPATPATPPVREEPEKPAAPSKL